MMESLRACFEGICGELVRSLRGTREIGRSIACGEIGESITGKGEIRQIHHMTADFTTKIKVFNKLTTNFAKDSPRS
jgi:hypothetical protein